jgi:hypothetical protein
MRCTLCATQFVSSSPAVQLVRLPDYLSRTMTMTSPSSKLAIRKSVFDEVGGHRNSTPQTFHNDDLHILLKLGTYGPCVAIQKPYTFAYRLHEANSIRNVKAIADGMLELARLERQGQYSGGSKRRRDRYAVIGGRASTWAVRYCWRGGQRKLAFRLILGTAPMVAAAVWKKFLRYFHKGPELIVLPE